VNLRTIRPTDNVQALSPGATISRVFNPNLTVGRLTSPLKLLNLNVTPAYLHSLLIDHSTSSSMSLRSSHQPLFTVRRCRTEYGRRAFSVAAPEVWNKLPPFVQLSDTIRLFRSRLKHFYSQLHMKNFDNDPSQALLLPHGFMALYKCIFDLI
jgi:hypothetical protein